VTTLFYAPGTSGSSLIRIPDGLAELGLEHLHLSVNLALASSFKEPRP